MWRPGSWSTPTANSPLSGSSTPPPQQPQGLRSYAPSPLGRHPGAARPALYRESSISLAGSTPNASTASLPAQVKQQQATGYKKAVSMPPPPGVADPIGVLEGILGVPVNIDKRAKTAGGAEKDEVVMPDIEDARGIDFGELSLEEFAAKGERKGEYTERRRAYTERTAEEYEREKWKFQDLHRSIKACDEVLKSVESYLYAFQTDLGTVSAEIESLQNRSTSLNQRLENRKEVEKLLGPVVDDIVLPPRDVRRLVEGDVNDTWVRTLHETDRRIKAIESKDPSVVKAAEEIQPEIEKIKHKTIERVRDFFVSRIKALRVPGANAQVIQQQGFLRYKELFQFMANHRVELAEEIAQAYTNTMKWYYSTYFQRYHKAFEKIKLHTMDKNDVLGQDEPTRKTNLLPTLKSVSLPAYDPFNIGRRIEVLRNRTAPILGAHAAEDDRSTHYPEYAFRHFNTALIENTASEYTFLTEFFSYKNRESLDRIFHTMFSSTFALSQSFTKQLIDHTNDALGILICVRLNQYALFEMQKRRIPAVEGYLNATNMLLWPRFQIVMDAHCESLRKSVSSSSSSRLQQQTAAPHPLTQRFASLLHGVLALSAEAGDDDGPVQASLGRLRSDFEAFLTKLSGGIADTKKRERFLFNNYSLVGTIIGDTDGKLASEMKEHFERLKMAFRE